MSMTLYSKILPSKTYEEWVNDFIIDIMVYTDDVNYYKVKYVDACAINNKICTSFNTYQLYEDYMYRHNLMMYFMLSIVYILIALVVYSMYKCSKMMCYSLFVTILYFWFNT